MNRRMAVRLLAAAGAGSFLSAHGDDENYIVRSEVRLVLLDVSVTNGKGEFIPGLSKSNFTVLEDGRTQEITAFDNSDIPVTAGLIVDESRSMTPKREDVLGAATT